MSDPNPAALTDVAIAAAAGLAPKPSKLVPALLVVNLLMTGGVVAHLLLKKPSVEAHAAEAHADPEGSEHGKAEGGAAAHAPGGMGPTVRLADFVVHLRNVESERYARMSFELEIGAEADKERVNQTLAKIRELFLAYLSDRTVEELRGSEGMERAKRDLLAKVTAGVPGTPVRAVYITDVVIQ